MPAATPDLSTRIRQRSPERLAALLAGIPTLGEALHGHGPLARIGRFGLVSARGAGVESPTVERVAEILSTRMGIDVRLAALDRTARDLVSLAVWHGGALSREKVLAEVAASSTPEDAEVATRLDDAVVRLHDLLLIDPEAGWLVLAPDVADTAGLPGVPARPSMERVTSDVLAQLLAALGVRRAPTRKAERLDALEALLRDGDTLRAVTSRLSADAARVLDILLSEGPKAIEDLGLAPHYAWDRTPTPLRELTGLGLVGIDPDDQWCWAWLDLTVARQGCLIAEWPAEPAPEPRPVHDPGGLPAVLGRVTALLDAWRAEPAPGLAGGGLGVRPVRAVAKQLGVPAGEAGLLVSLAIGLGLLDRIQVGSTGRGRNTKIQWAWTPTPLAAEFAAMPAEARWNQLVQAWRDEESLDETEGLPERLQETDMVGISLYRSALLRLLAELPAGTGLPTDELEALAAHRQPTLLAGQATTHLVTAARILGLVPAEGPVGLTTLGRAVLDGPAVLAAALPPPSTSFVVQADLSVVAPPDLAPDVTARLDRYAELESHAGARLYRLTEARLAAAMDAGDDDDAIVGFLDDHATAPLAQNVTYLVRDVARRHGRVRSGSCASYVRSEEPALISSALSVKAAKLRGIAPGVAVSPLQSAKVVAALRAKGLMPVPEDADGAVLRPGAPEPAPPEHDRGLPPLRESVEADALRTRRLAADLLAAEPAPPRAVDPNDPWGALAALTEDWGDDGLLDELWDDDDPQGPEANHALLRALMDLESRFGERGA